MEPNAVRAGRGLRSAQVSGIYAAAVVPVGLAATLVSIALVEAAHHLLPDLVRGEARALANLVSPLAIGFAAYFVLARWAHRRGHLERGIVAHWLRAASLYVVALWLGVLLTAATRDSVMAFTTLQLMLWPFLAVVGGVLGDALAASLARWPSRRPEVVIAMAAAVAGCAFAVLSPRGDYRRSRMVSTIGLPAPGRTASEMCRSAPQRQTWHSLPGRLTYCHGRADASGGAVVEWYDVGIDVLTRRPAHARRVLQMGDSANWGRTLDSIEVALGRRGGRKVACDPFTFEGGRTPVSKAEYWGFPGHTVRLTARTPLFDQRRAVQGRWTVELLASRRMTAKCDQYRRPSRHPGH